MAMQDKDFDKLFNQKFEDFEVEPSPMAWDNIAAELDGNKKPTRSVMPWLSIAAAILIIATSGVLFLKGDTRNGEGNKISKVVSKPVKPATTVKPDIKVKTEAVVAAKSPAVAKAYVPANHQQPTTVAQTSIIPVDVKPADVVEHDPTVSEKPITANVPNPVSTKPAAIVPDVQLTPATPVTDAQSTVEKPVMASAEKQNTEPVKKRGIQSFGGLINALVAKLDKRDDKLIEFSDGDDGDDNATKLTGVNLGLIKIKKQ